MKTLRILFLSIDLVIEVLSCSESNTTVTIDINTGEPTILIHSSLLLTSCEKFTTSNIEIVDTLDEEAFVCAYKKAGRFRNSAIL